MSNLRATTVLLLVACVGLLATPARAGLPTGKCQEVLGKAATTYVEGSDIEVGEVAGLINGALYLRYEDKEATIDPATTKPNMVITTKLGNLNLWVDGPSRFEPDGSVSRVLTTLAAQGSGTYSRAKINLIFSGTWIPGKEGTGGYDVTGTICFPQTTPRR